MYREAQPGQRTARGGRVYREAQPGQRTARGGREDLHSLRDKTETEGEGHIQTEGER